MSDFNNPNDPESNFNSNEDATKNHDDEKETQPETESRYSWNYDMGKESAKKGKSKWMVRTILVIAIVVSIGILGLAGTGIYYIYNQYAQNNSQDSKSNDDSSNSHTMTIQDAPATTEATSTLSSGELTTEQIVSKVAPSVVGIVSTVQAGNATAQGTGSGIIMSSDGYVVTNAHVIEGASKVEVYLNDGTKYDAKKIGSDTKTDLAVLKIDVAGLTAATFGNSDEVQVGSRAVAIGSPYSIEFAGTVTQGVVSAINRDIDIDGRNMTLLQTDASINPGNSGGPLINKYGQVIGINSLKIASSQFEGLGFAIPINSAQPIVNDLIEVGYVKGRPLIGISGVDVGNEMSAMLYGEIQGVQITEIDAKSNAGKAGLKVDDIIVKVDGEVVRNMTELNREKDTHSAGDTIILTVYRDNALKDIKLVLIENIPS